MLKRFAAYGWAARRIDGHDPQQINAALSFAMRSKKPTLIACRTIIGLGAPTKAGTAATHGSPLGAAGGGGGEGGARAGTSRRSPCPTICWSAGAAAGGRGAGSAPRLAEAPGPQHACGRSSSA